MNRIPASQYFRGHEKFNCAQAIAKAFQDEFNVPDEIIVSYADKGSGRAEGGLCGSAFAAINLFKDSKDKLRFEQLYTERAGSMICKELKKIKKMSCKERVDLSADIIYTIQAPIS